MAKSKAKKKAPKRKSRKKAARSVAPPERVAEVTMRRMAIADLKRAPYNPRIISDSARKGLAASLKRFGVLQPVCFNEKTGHLVGGHKRLDELEAEGYTHTDVVITNLAPIEEKAANVSMNNPAIAGEFDHGLQAVLDSVKLELPEDVFVGLRLDELDVTPPGELNEGTTPEPPKKPKTKLGDVITLGRHRLICGDSTDADVVAALLDGAKPGIMVTDPPYGVGYDPVRRSQALKDGGNRAEGKVLNDERVDWREAYALFPGDVAYVWHIGTQGPPVAEGMNDCGLDLRVLIVWGKQQHTFGRGHYHSMHEGCWYGVKKGRTAKWCGGRKQTTLWEIDKNRVNETGHATQKPIECMARPLRNHDFPEVYDPFLGSGTTLVAAEQLDRTCYGVELSPGYCDVIVGRFLSLWPDAEVTRERKGKVRPWR